MYVISKFLLMKKAIVIAFGLFVFLPSCDTYQLTGPGNLVPLTVDEDATLPSISVNGTQLHAETYGDPGNTMIVVLHGGPGGDYRSMLNCQRFADDGFFVVFYDQRGSGLSKRHPAEIYTIQIFIDDLQAVIEHYRQYADQKVILLGQSWGAMLATAYINAYPDRIHGAVLTEPGGFTWSDTKEYLSRTQKLKLLDEGTNDFVYLDQFLTGHDHATLDYKASLRRAADQEVGNASLTPVWRSGAVCSSAAMKYAEEHSFDFTTNLHAFNTKILFGYSEFNNSYGKEHAVKVSSAYPNVQLHEFKGTGHSIPYFGWSEYYPVALSYLKEIE